MNKLVLILVAAGIFLSCNSYKTTPAGIDSKEQKQPVSTYEPGKTGTSGSDTSLSIVYWPEKEKKGFINSCIRSAVTRGMDLLLATRYCNCMQGKMEKMFPDVNEAEQLSDADMERPAIMKEISKCLGQE